MLTEFGAVIGVWVVSCVSLENTVEGMLESVEAVSETQSATSVAVLMHDRVLPIFLRGVLAGDLEAPEVLSRNSMSCMCRRRSEFATPSLSIKYMDALGNMARAA